MKKLAYGITTICSLLWLTPTFALNKANSFTFSLGGGYVDLSSKRRVEDTGFSFAAIGYNATDRWRVEVFAGFFNSRSHKPEDNNQQVTGNVVAVNALYHFSPFKTVLVPYVMGGIGATGLSPNGFDARSEGNINAGVGLQAFISEDIAFRFEGRDFFTINGGKNDLYADAGVTIGFPL